MLSCAKGDGVSFRKEKGGVGKGIEKGQKAGCPFYIDAALSL